VKHEQRLRNGKSIHTRSGSDGVDALKANVWGSYGINLESGRWAQAQFATGHHPWIGFSVYIFTGTKQPTSRLCWLNFELLSAGLLGERGETT
jgi:hypothetical protein